MRAFIGYQYEKVILIGFKIFYHTHKFWFSNLKASVCHSYLADLCSSQTNIITDYNFQILTMALSAAEKCRRYRERQKAKFGAEELQKKDAARKRQSYNKDIKASREKKRIKQKCYRARKVIVAESMVEQSKTPESSSVYSNQSSQTRAVKRACSVMPPSPNKRSAVIKQLAKIYETDLNPAPESRPPPANKIPDDVKSRVKEFYLRNDISWMAPGRKDCITVKRDGKKERAQRRYLVMTIREAHALYMEEYSDDQVQLTTFKSLRPDVVLLKSDMPHNVCVCQYHENVKLLLEAMEGPLKSPADHRTLLHKICCSIEEENCMYGDCDVCKYKTSLDSLAADFTDEQLNTRISWKNWTKTGEGKTEKKKFTGTVSEALGVLSGQLPDFKIHFFVKNKQAKNFQDNHNKPMGRHHVHVQVDYSENASIIDQDEIQSAHWTHPQVTCFTAVAWTEGGAYSYCINSNCLTHDKYSAATFLKVLLDDLQTKLSTPVTEVDIYSDGAAQHFKSKYMWLFITSLLDKGITVRWHYTATSHGKGAVDGIGGTVKRLVHSAQMSRRYQVSNARDYADLARRLTDSINIIYVDNTDIDTQRPELAEMWKSVITLQGTQGMHCVRAVSYGVVAAARYSEKEGDLHNLLPAAPKQAPVISTESDQSEVDSEDTMSGTDQNDLPITAGHWYAVRWEPTAYWYIGRAIQEAGDGKWTFSFIHQTSPTANKFRPVNDFEIVLVKDVFVAVECPDPTSSTRTCTLKLTPKDFKMVLEKF